MSGQGGVEGRGGKGSLEEGRGEFGGWGWGWGGGAPAHFADKNICM